MMDRKEIDANIISYLRSYDPERIGIFGSLARQEIQIISAGSSMNLSIFSILSGSVNSLN